MFCVSDLVALTGGELRMAAMPPMHGELTAIRRLVLAAEDCGSGDVVWCQTSGPAEAELAFLRGAIGVVVSRWLEPWPGRFCLKIADPTSALVRLRAVF